MKYTIISHLTALNVYRHLRLTGQMYKLSIFDEEKIYPENNIEALINSRVIPPASDLGKIDLLIFDKNQMHQHNNISWHCLRNQFPKGSFNKIDNNILITSPELTISLLAANYPIEKVLLWALEMCGTYSLPYDGKFDFSNGFSPLTTVKDVSKYVLNLSKTYEKFKGLKMVRRSIRFMNNDSASPQESILYAIFVLPKRDGAFGIKGIVFNKPILLSKEAQKICGQKIIIPDLSIPKTKIAIEYDSNQFHDNAKQNITDKNRLNALAHEGWKVFNIVPGIYDNFDALFHITKDILKANHQDCRIRSENFYIKHDELISSLINPL